MNRISWLVVAVVVCGAAVGAGWWLRGPGDVVTPEPVAVTEVVTVPVEVTRVVTVAVPVTVEVTRIVTVESDIADAADVLPVTPEPTVTGTPTATVTAPGKPLELPVTGG